MLKINSLEIENVKRVKAVKLEPSPTGLTVIGGKNGQGKTSVLDAIAWTLGGNKFKPSQPNRDGSVVPPHLHLELSNGLIVERNGKNSSLKIIDKNGNKGGQQLLDEFIDQMALNLPKFMAASNKQKADILLQIIGVGEKLYEIESRETQIYNRRAEIGRIADQKKKYAAELEIYPGVPKKPVSASELIHRQQEILARNGENARKRQNIDKMQDLARNLHSEIDSLQVLLNEKKAKYNQVIDDLEIANKSALELYDESTAELEKSISEIDEINIKVRANCDREKAEMDAAEYTKQYDALSLELQDIRQSKTDLLQSANLPLKNLSVENGELIYKGFKWDNMSGSEQLKVATAIVRKLNPNCGFVLLDKLEQMDVESMREFGEWLEGENLQVIATRVSTSDDECSIIIEDGYVKETDDVSAQKTTWERGKF